MEERKRGIWKVRVREMGREKEEKDVISEVRETKLTNNQKQERERESERDFLLYIERKICVESASYFFSYLTFFFLD